MKTTKIVLTGGPCAGKTTALAHIVEHFTNLNIQVYVLPEVATLFSQAGVNFLTQNKSYFYQAEKSLLRMQVEMENRFEDMAKKCGKPAIIVCDRGTMDISAYLTNDTWQAITNELKTDIVQLRDARYDAVIHMVTAADGAEKFYNNANNQFRTESIEEAKMLDRKLINAWTGHPHLRVVDNAGTFEQKINRVLQEIASLLGVPYPIEIERKYLVEVTGEIPSAVETEIFQTYLSAEPNKEVRVRKRGSNGSYVCFKTIKTELSDTNRIETESQITPEQYVDLLNIADKQRQTIHKTRKSFVWQGQYFELDTYLQPNTGFTILEIEGISEHAQIKFPPFLTILKDVTGDKEFYNYNLAKK